MSQPSGLAAQPWAYPDAELYVIGRLEQFLPDLATLGVSDSDIDTYFPDGFNPPFIRVQRTGGVPDASDVTDYPIVSISTLGNTRHQAWDLSRMVERIILGAKGRSVDGVLCDYAAIAEGAQQVPDLDPDDRRVDRAYGLGFRRHAPT
jgi:hypothetical protein